MTELPKIDNESEDLVADRLEQLRDMLPETFSESGIDFDKLRLLLGDEVDEGDERYAFTWPGKADAIRQSQTSTRATLRPCPEKSRGRTGEDGSFDSDNLYIEGDNLEVLKLLQRAYHGQVKLIYIDPPYNTGHDFVYHDSFGDTIENYKEQTGQANQSNPETSGRYHSAWCTMMYPRLRLARELMARDGVVFISIDDAEVSDLRMICDEVFGSQNFVACLVYDKNRKNDARYYSVGHEYMLVYFKDAGYYSDEGIVWRAPKEGVDDVRKKFDELKRQYGTDWDRITQEMRQWYSTWDADDPRKPLARFNKVDEYGPYRDDGNISWPGGGGPKYEVLHPLTGKPCKVPDAGWRFPRPERMQEEIDAGRVVFGPDESTLPRIRRNLFEADGQVLKSVKFSYAQTATVEFNKLFDNQRVFENPKNLDDIEEIITYVTSNDRDALILDFFSGSATTGHAVIAANQLDNGNRRYILVQIPELTPEKSIARRMNLMTICDIGEERIRRAGDKIAEEVVEANRQPKIGEEPKQLPDIGFRVFRLDESGIAEPEGDQMLIDRIKGDRDDLDIIFEVMLKWGYELTYPIERDEFAGYPVYSVAAGDLICCMDEGLTVDALEDIAAAQPRRVFVPDRVFGADDSLKLNALAIFKRVEERTQQKIDLRTV